MFTGAEVRIKNTKKRVRFGDGRTLWRDLETIMQLDSRKRYVENRYANSEKETENEMELKGIGKWLCMG